MDGTDTGGCRGCGLGYDERKGGRWGGGETGGWVTPTDPGPQRSAESHSASAPYAGDDGFQGGAHGGAGWPGAVHDSGDAITGPLVSNLLCAMLGCSSANAVAPGEAGQARVSNGQYAVEMAAALTAAKYLGAVAGAVGGELGVGAVEGISAAERGAASAAREATGFLGSKRAPLANAPYQPLRNADTVIGGRKFGGHALDQMQNRGLVPSVVENAIQHGVRSLDPIPGRYRFFDAANKITVIAEGEGAERVITVIPGKR